jgi:pimeloyl-ACP methyl ester carboxylesterase
VFVANSDGTKTFVKEAGNSNNEAVVLLHGIGADHKMWEPQLQLFAENGFYVLAPDLLGHGKSSKVNTLELSDWEHQINELLHHANITKCHLVGVSMGGVIAQSYVMHHEDKVSRLVLSDTFGELKTFQEKLLGFSQVLGFRIYKLLGGKMLAKGMASAYKAPFAERAREYFSQVSLRADFDQLVIARKAINKIDAIGKIDGDRVPTLVLVGDQFGNSFVEINQKIAKGIKGAKFTILKNSMDPSNLVNPDDFNQVVLQFFSRTPSTMNQENQPCKENDYFGSHAKLILSSFLRATGKNLIDNKLPEKERFRLLFEAPFCVVSHNTEDDPVFNYGNKTALELFEMNWEDFTNLPSRHSAEPQVREEREKLLARVTQNGFIDDYQGVRISSSGRRFMVEDSIVWNMIDESGVYRGQAAVLYKWSWL